MSIRRKMQIIVLSVAALAVGAVATVSLLSINRYSDSAVRARSAITADVIQENCIPALLFYDPDGANEVLTSL